MEHLVIPDGYRSPLTIRETEVAIKEVKDHFERALAKSLHLTRVSAPLFVRPEWSAPSHSASGNRMKPRLRLFTPLPSGNAMPSSITVFTPEKAYIRI